jgi:hypothetical protein
MDILQWQSEGIGRVFFQFWCYVRYYKYNSRTLIKNYFTFQL